MTSTDTLKVNGIEITAKQFAFDGCHKIYLINSDDDRAASQEHHYEVLPISELQDVYENSCGLRFINHWDLNLDAIASQFEDATFEGFNEVLPECEYCLKHGSGACYALGAEPGHVCANNAVKASTNAE